ncbi:MFS transporter [candidate division KSB1 bacterium]|nr:MFS transporter [candidate division KSB1 bacterium]
MKSKFPGTFWTANTIELFERGAYYAIASFVVIYLHETLGMEPTKATFLNGTLLWGLIYFLPILSGTLADKFGFKRSLVLAFIFIAGGYLIMGTVQQFWPALLGKPMSEVDFTFPIVLGIVFIGVGGSFVKPCISGTIQKTAGSLATLGFGIFYMVINIGSMTGRTVSYLVRITYGIPAIFSYVATAFSLVALLIVIFIYREPQYQESPTPATMQKPKTLGQALLGMFTVLKNYKFVFFLIVIGFFWFIYVQIYNLIPLYLRFVDKDAPVELYTLMNPIMIVCFQLLITKFSKKYTPLVSMMMGVGVTVVGMTLNIIPWLVNTDAAAPISLGAVVLPFAGIVMFLSLASMAVGEMLASPRVYEYIGAIAPKGQEGLYLGYANLPLALGTIVGAPIGGILFTEFVQKPAALNQPVHTTTMWLLVASMGVVSFIGLYLYDRFLLKK